MDPTFRGVPVVLDSDVNPVDVAYLEGLSQSVVQTVYYGDGGIAGELIPVPPMLPVYWWNGVKLATIDTSSAEPAPADKPEKRIDEMTLADYRAGIAKVFNGGRLLP